MQALVESLKAEGIISAPREKSDSLWWLADGSQRFLSFRDGAVTLWRSFQPYAANEIVDSLPDEQATVETVAAMVFSP